MLASRRECCEVDFPLFNCLRPLREQLCCPPVCSGYEQLENNQQLTWHRKSQSTTRNFRRLALSTIYSAIYGPERNRLGSMPLSSTRQLREKCAPLRLLPQPVIDWVNDREMLRHSRLCQDEKAPTASGRSPGLAVSFRIFICNWSACITYHR